MLDAGARELRLCYAKRVAGIGSKVAVCVFVLGVVAARPAGAEPVHLDTPPDDRIEDESERWYGWQTLALDGTAAVLWLSAIPATEQAEVNLLATGALTFALGAPIVHVAHSRPWVGAGTFVLRVASPVLGTMVGQMFDESNGCSAVDSSCDSSAIGTIAGGFTGAALAAAFDAGFLGYEPVPKPRRGLTRAPLPNLLAPFVRAEMRGASLGLLGSF